MENAVNNFKEHFSHAIIVLLFLCFGITIFFAVAHDPFMRIIVLGLVSMSYAVWGIVHHFMRKDLTWAMVLEYVIIAFLALVGAISILGWGTL